MNTDWFPKHWPRKVQASEKGGGAGGVQWHVSLRYFLDFNSLKSPFMGFLVIQTGYWPVPFSLDGALQNSGLLLLFLMPRNKNLSNFPEKMETSVDLHLGILMGFGLFCATY